MEAAHSITITYIAADCDSIIPGKSKAAAVFRNDLNISTKLLDAGVGKIRNKTTNLSVLRQVRQHIAKYYAENAKAFQLVLRGECCMLPAILSSVKTQWAPKRVGLVYIDADMDLVSPLDGIGRGRPGFLQDEEMGFEEKLVDAPNTMFFGTNMQNSGNTKHHFAYVFDEGYKLVFSAAVAACPEERAQDALEYLEGRGIDVICVHLDVDAIDWGEFLLANVPNFTGVALEKMMAALRVFLKSERMVGLSVAEIYSDHDPGYGMMERLWDQIIGMLVGTEETKTAQGVA